MQKHTNICYQITETIAVMTATGGGNNRKVARWDMTNDCCNIWPVSVDSPAVKMSVRYRSLINLNVLITKVSSIAWQSGRQLIYTLHDLKVYLSAWYRECTVWLRNPDETCSQYWITSHNRNRKVLLLTTCNFAICFVYCHSSSTIAVGTAVAINRLYMCDKYACITITCLTRTSRVLENVMYIIRTLCI